MNTAKVIISEHPIPYPKNGSWSQRMEYFLESDYNCIDYYICGKTNGTLKSKTTFYRVNQYKSKFISKFFKGYRYKEYTKSIRDLLLKHDHLIICVVDNVKLKIAINSYLEKNNALNKVTLIFYNCGYSYYLDDTTNATFLKNCSEMIFLTENAYLYNKQKYIEFTPEVTIINNPVNKQKFFSIPKLEKESLLKENQLQDKIVYLWLSHDREKKGLNIVLNAWKDWNKSPNEAQLLVVGAKRSEKINGVQFIGQVPSDLVDKYYKMAHVYLFPTLCKEGFGLSLAQAMCCGCFSIAANNGGVSDFFNSENGILIDSPNIVANWVKSFNESFELMNQNYQVQSFENQILSNDEWCLKFAKVFDKWEQRFKGKT